VIQETIVQHLGASRNGTFVQLDRNGPQPYSVPGENRMNRYLDHSNLKPCHRLSDYLDSETKTPSRISKFTISSDDLTEGWMKAPFDLVALWISVGDTTEETVKYRGRLVEATDVLTL
jgi:hypothetical protein